MNYTESVQSELQCYTWWKETSSSEWTNALKPPELFFQVQPGWRSEVRRDRAGDGDRLTRTSTSCGSMTQRPYTQTQTHLHFRKSRRLVKMLESFRKTGNIWSRILLLFFFFFSFCHLFKKTTFHICFCFSFFFCRQIFLFCRGGSLRFINLPSAEGAAQLQTDFVSKHEAFCGERRQTHDCLFLKLAFRFKLQGPKSSTSRSHTTDRTLFAPCATCGSAVLLTRCVFIVWTEPATHSSECQITVCL